MADAPTSDDPALEFYTGALCNATFNLTPSLVAPLVPANSVSVPSPFGPFVRLQLKAIQLGAAATTFWVVVSVDLIAKP